MHLRFRRAPSCLVVAVSGELDLSSARIFKDRVDGELRRTGAPNLIINMEGLEFVDSTGLGAIFGRHQSVTQGGGRLFLSGVTPKIGAMISMAGLEGILPRTRTDEDALHILGSQGGPNR